LSERGKNGAEQKKKNGFREKCFFWWRCRHLASRLLPTKSIRGASVRFRSAAATAARQSDRTLGGSFSTSNNVFFRFAWNFAIRLCSGLPDRLLSNQKSQFEKNSQGLRFENIDIFYVHLEYFMAIWNILWPFGIFSCHLANSVFIWYIFSSFGIVHQEKSGNPACVGLIDFLALYNIIKSVF
jgi:hypothetical protein